ncbi:hypothetical protein F5Y15DRAFT_79050 [Xylariaceae sp. FL0016]|nr:hypothetical protein F5Y15DRAFT_79050 [Xylariaceae sp. FL0016]
MVSSRKRALRDIEPAADASQPSPTTTSLQRIRNCWQFSNLFQWIYLFGKVVKIDENLDIDDLEAECLKPSSPILVNIGLALLKFVSSHRGLTPELFDEYTRRQYVAKAPDRNPFGIDESPAHFDDFDALLKLRVLQQLTQWVMLHPERIRDKMEEQRPSDQTEWRIEPTGWDSDDRTYYILDDNRLYRMTPAAPTTASWKPKKNTKKAKAAARAPKRRRVSRSTAQSGENVDDDSLSDSEDAQEPQDNGLGGATWECIGVSLEDIQAFLATIRKSRDENEKVLRSCIEEHLLPLLEKQEESRKRKALQREKELLNLEKMSHAKRSSRLANKAEQQRHEEQARQDEERRRVEEAAARKEEQKRIKMEKEHDSRAKSREVRLEERKRRRLQAEEELAQLSEDSKTPDGGNGRMSQRRLKDQIDRNKQALQELDDEEDDWIFDCICGVYGQVDDGTHSIACETCNIWQHSKCVGISEAEADSDNFHFICKSCRRKQNSRTEHPIIRLKVNKPGRSSPHPKTDKADSPIQQANGAQEDDFIVEPTTQARGSARAPSFSQVATEKSSLEPLAQPSGLPTIPVKQAGQPHVLPPPSPHINGDGAHAFSSPHPTLSPPQQSPNKSRAYSTLFNPSSPAGGEAKLPQKGIFHVSPKSNGGHSSSTIVSVTAGSDSPVKQLRDTTSKESCVSSPPTAAVVANSIPGQKPNVELSPRSLVLSTPQLNKTRPLQNDLTPSLPPTKNGISPSKRSPPPQQTNNCITSSPAPAILPPVTALSPSPSEQIMTPPVKPTDPARPPSQHSSFVSDL